MAYCSAAQFLKRFDDRDVRDLVSDTGTAVTTGAIATDEILLQVLDDASGDIDAALQAGGRYSAADLSGLTGNNANKLERMTAEIAMLYLLERRPSFNPDQLERFEKIRNRHLEPLRKGTNIFALADAITAGAASVDGPTTQNYTDLNLVRDRVQNYYPRRRLPDNR